MSINNRNVIDIEYEIGDMRPDMIMLDENGDIYLVENKVGNGSLSSRSLNPSNDKKAGLAKHYKDYLSLLNNEDNRENIVMAVEEILRIKKRLGLIPESFATKGNKEERIPQFYILFVLANLTLSSNSKILANEQKAILDIQDDKYLPYLIFTDKDEYIIKLDSKKSFMDLTFSK